MHLASSEETASVLARKVFTGNPPNDINADSVLLFKLNLAVSLINENTSY